MSDEYEMKRAAEEAEKTKLRVRLRDILKNLGYYAPFKNTDYAYAEAEGKLGDEVIYLVANTYQHKGMIHVYGGYPRTAKGEYIYLYPPLKDVSINVSLKKSDSQIASDISKRFLPAYRENLALVLEKKKQTDDYVAQKEGLLNRVAEKTGIKPYGDRVYEYDFADGIGRFEAKILSASEVDVEIRFTESKLFEFLDWLQANTEKKKEDD